MEGSLEELAGYRLVRAKGNPLAFHGGYSKIIIIMAFYAL